MGSLSRKCLSQLSLCLAALCILAFSFAPAQTSFGPPNDIVGPSPLGAASVFAADLDGDGDQDVLSASFNDNRIAWYENRLDEATADFGLPRTISSAANGAFSVYSADLDGDGDQDVLSASQNDDRIAWYENRLNEATADFGPQQTITTAADGASSVFAADLDGDGDQDVLSASLNDDRIAWYENRLDEGTADFGPQQTITTAANGARSVHAADLDGDGDQDVLSASTNNNRITWYENRLDEPTADFDEQDITTAASFAASVFATDLDGDGDKDVLSASASNNRITWYENRLDEPTADFDEQTITTAANGAISVFAADLDGDGDQDVLSASFIDDRIAWYMNRLDEATADFGPQQTITTAANFASSVFAADLDGDGDSDVLSADLDIDQIAWYENRLDEPSADFSSPLVVNTIADGAFSVFATDIDGDGDQDVLSGNIGDGRIVWYENRLDEATADFGLPRTISSTANGAYSVFAADLDGDGDQDVLSAAEFGDGIAWYENRLDEPTADFIGQAIGTDSEGFPSVFAADLDGDGDPDVLAAFYIDDRIEWYENRLDEPTADFGSPQAVTLNADGASSVFAIDLDGDGDNDVLSANEVDDRVVWYENRLDEPTADFDEQTIFNVPNAGAVYASDLDGDGDADVLSSSSFSNRRIAWYENRLDEPTSDFGTQQVITTNISPVLIQPRNVFAADLDGDCDPDVLSASFNDNRIAWYENRLDEATADFGPQQNLTTQAIGAVAVYTADLDGDGDQDVLSTSGIDDRIAWYENTTPVPTRLVIDTTPSPPLTLDFDNFELGSLPASLSSVIGVINVCDPALLTTVTLTDDAGGAFSLTSIPISPLAVGATDTLEVTFAPITLGPVTGEVSIETNTTSGTVTIALSGTGVDTQEPTSTATGPTGSLTQPSPIFAVTFTATDNAGGSGVATVDLFYQRNGGGYTQYPGGPFTASPISFDTTSTGGDGSYDFYTVATDVAGNTETKAPAAEASVVFNDTTAVGEWTLLDE